MLVPLARMASEPPIKAAEFRQEMNLNTNLDGEHRRRRHCHELNVAVSIVTFRLLIFISHRPCYQFLAQVTGLLCGNDTRDEDTRDKDTRDEDSKGEDTRKML